ncbi:hypothetical protein GY45DRAFT_1375416 [Cubamyces sp. BRFM 1775]|nr:hypothetical protein GY45DRAFT_1375416 [Cubamyces sp. BRFM 1775]
MPNLNEVPYIPLATEDVLYKIEVPGRNDSFAPGRIVVGELERATYGFIFCPTERPIGVSGPAIPTLSTVIDERVHFCCDEREGSVILDVASVDSHARFTFCFRDILAFYELVRILAEAKAHIASQRDVHLHKLDILYRDQFVDMPNFSRDATTHRDDVAADTGNPELSLNGTAAHATSTPTAY